MLRERLFATLAAAEPEATRASTSRWGAGARGGGAWLAEHATVGGRSGLAVDGPAAVRATSRVAVAAADGDGA